MQDAMLADEHEERCREYLPRLILSRLAFDLVWPMPLADVLALVELLGYSPALPSIVRLSKFGQPDALTFQASGVVNLLCELEDEQAKRAAADG